MDAMMSKMSIISLKLAVAILATIFFFAYWIFNFVILYHLTRFGIGTEPKKIAIIFLLGSISIFSISIILFAGIDISTLGQRLGISIANITNQK